MQASRKVHSKLILIFSLLSRCLCSYDERCCACVSNSNSRKLYDGIAHIKQIVTRHSKWNWLYFIGDTPRAGGMNVEKLYYDKLYLLFNFLLFNRTLSLSFSPTLWRGNSRHEPTSSTRVGRAEHQRRKCLKHSEGGQDEKTQTHNMPKIEHTPESK